MKNQLTRLVMGLISIISLTSVRPAQSREWRNRAPQSAAVTAAPVVKISGSMKGGFVVTDGPCAVGFSSQCPGSDCSCYTVTGTASLSRIGKGAATISATLDFGSGVLSGDGDCFPVYLVFDFSTANDSETWSGVGSACDSVESLSLPLRGGLGLQTSALYTGAIMQFVMVPNFSKQTFNVNYQGKAER